MDPEPDSERWHQIIQPFAPNNKKGTVLLGFCCDEGVRRNHGRVGAKDAPNAIRHALANLPWHGNDSLYDAGNIACDDGNLEKAQMALCGKIADILLDYVPNARHLPIVLGGGHEIAFASWLGIFQYRYESTHFKTDASAPNIGIINFDAHFDLRTPEYLYSQKPKPGMDIMQMRGHSGTPFSQIQQSCYGPIKFQYAALGINRASNTKALFQRANQFNTWFVEDQDINLHTLPALQKQLEKWMCDKNDIYLSFDIDVLPASQAPGCSAPAALGVELSLLLPLLQQIKDSGKLILADIAEVNPTYDIDSRTAKVAARIVELLAR